MAQAKRKARKPLTAAQRAGCSAGGKHTLERYGAGHFATLGALGGKRAWRRKSVGARKTRMQELARARWAKARGEAPAAATPPPFDAFE